MKTRQAKKIVKSSFTYLRYLVVINRAKEYRPLPYWSHGFPDAPNLSIEVYKELDNPRFRKAMKVTRKFWEMVYKVAREGMMTYYSKLMEAEKEIHRFPY